MAATEAGEARPGTVWPDRWVLAGLVAAAAVLHGWMVGHTAVAARDSIGFIRYALVLDENPWSEVLPHIEQHPGYPAALLVVSWPLRWFLGTTPAVMALAAQLTSALAGVLLVIPLYYLAREFFDRRSAVTAALLFQCLPICLQVTSDGLSEGLYLFFVVSALALAVQALRLRSPLRFALAGFFTGLAYLTRPEGALVAPVVLVVLASVPLAPAVRWPWRRALACAASFALATGATSGPNMATIGSVTPKPATLQLMDSIGQVHEPQRTAPTVVTSPPLASLFGAFWNSQVRSAWWGVWALALEVARSLQYVVAVPALVGAWWFRSRLQQPGAWLVLGLFGLQAAALCWMSAQLGYLSERHTLPLALIALLPAGAALVALGDWLAGRYRPAPSSAVVGLLTGLMACAAFVPSAIHPLHANRAGHRAAGEWLAEHAGADDVILDPFCWAHFYSGRFTRCGFNPPADQRIDFVILEKSTNPHDRLPALQKARLLAARGTLIYQWSPPKAERKRKAEIVEVYAVPAARE